jgi:hypothetical protein
MSLDDGHATGYQLALSGRGPHMSDVVDIIDRSASPADAARVAAVVESYFLPCGCCASTRSSLMHPDEPAPHFEYFEHQAGADAFGAGSSTRSCPFAGPERQIRFPFCRIDP